MTRVCIKATKQRIVDDLHGAFDIVNAVAVRIQRKRVVSRTICPIMCP